MDDEFEFVDNDKTSFDDFVDEDDTVLLNDDSISCSLQQDMKEVQELKAKLKAQCAESSKYLKKLKEQNSATSSLQSQLRKDLAEVAEMKAALLKEKQEFSDTKSDLSKLLSSAQEIPSTMSDTKSLLQQLNQFYGETSSIKAEMDKLKALRVKQQEMIDQCKINIETLNSNQRDCLVSLDQSKAFSCKECGTDIALSDEIESKCYQVGQGTFSEKKRGYLFKNATNVILGANKTEHFTTGSYQISWASCAKCNSQLGWKYISADKENNKVKEGKFCLSRWSLTSPADRAQK